MKKQSKKTLTHDIQLKGGDLDRLLPYGFKTKMAEEMGVSQQAVSQVIDRMEPTHPAVQKVAEQAIATIRTIKHLHEIQHFLQDQQKAAS